ncbi:PilZ domain-containing protein [Rugamonas apoptosis]|uniref:PilZ domain-containing protein n=1 Tax=Rugamonas apoptosis TaxID=2758570 RepID=A0A7W2F9D0_9BURK|nr:PilZ domain-containing protein [Rugamonas apoptosis]MBA5687518.1 PilZ domain-containing protein [Rugamonas apoptosis]
MRRMLQVDASIADQFGTQQWAVQIIDIARMGVAFVSNHSIPCDVPFLFSFCFPRSSVRNEVLLTVVHSTPLGTEGRYRNGARFLTISDDAVERIVDYVTSDGMHMA